MSDCIFCKIRDNEMPAFKVYEDDLFIVIMDRFPAGKGHVLIIPKEHAENIFEISDEVAKGLYPMAKKFAEVLKEVLGADGINIVQNNGLAATQAVFHFHLHVIPRFDGDKVRINQPTTYETTVEEIEEVAKLIKNAL
ncbi:MAG: histidine triad (HIT) protein [Epulopiscium sp. Nele67-Bin004]|nr:MAG: histidine triad (HIT) protein [Epulopiscium sp. Nele67-Bin004]